MDDEEGAITFLDQQKAFDRAEWGSANMFTFDSISGSFPFGKYMPSILGLRLMDAANGSAFKMYSIGAIGHL
jgi:hypothetical protein